MLARLAAKDPYIFFFSLFARQENSSAPQKNHFSRSSSRFNLPLSSVPYSRLRELFILRVGIYSKSFLQPTLRLSNTPCFHHSETKALFSLQRTNILNQHITGCKKKKKKKKKRNDLSKMDGPSRCPKSCASPATSTSPISPTHPTLNLMEQLLLAKMEKHSLTEEQQQQQQQQHQLNDGDEQHHLLLKPKRPRSTLLRTDSMDSQTSASTFSSLMSNDSGSGSNRYCRCDDCLLGIADKYQQSQPATGRKKVIDVG